MLWFKRILKNIILFVIIFVFAIGVIFTAEITARALGLTTTKATLVDIALFPYKHYVVTTHPANLELGKSDHLLEGFFRKNVCCTKDGVTARFNSDGFRTHEFGNVPKKEPGEIRLIITGGSASISWNIGETCTLDNHLYRLFEKHYPNKKIRIFNLGNGAWKSFQELIAIQMYGLKLEPDLIVTFDGFNDIQHSYSMPIEQPYSNTSEIAFKHYERWIQDDVLGLFYNLKIIHALKQPAKQAIGMIGRTKNNLIGSAPKYAEAAKPGALASHMEYPLDTVSIKNRQDFDPYNQQAVNFYLQNEKLMAKAADSVGAKIIFVLQPTLYYKDPLSDNEKRLLNTYAPAVNFVVQGYERMKEGLKHLTKSEKNASFYDMSNVFANDQQGYFADNCHFTAEGYEQVANKLFEEIRSKLEPIL